MSFLENCFTNTQHDGQLPFFRIFGTPLQVRQKLLSIRRQGADVVSLLLALPVFTEAIGKVNIPGALTELVLRMGRQPFNFILVGTFLLVGFGVLGSSSKPSVAKPNETKMFRLVFPYSLKKCCFLALEIVS